jgi:Putative Actinobacterial Holin-X, holin superfamily III
MNEPDYDRDRQHREDLANVHLPGLVGRMLDDLVRIGEAQAKLFELNIDAILSAALDRAIGRAVAAVMYLFGGLCFLGATIVLLHRELQWWEALAIAGSVVIVAGWLVQRFATRLAARQASRTKLE